MSTIVFSEPKMLEHRTGLHHAESPARLEAVLRAMDGLDVEHRTASAPASFEAIARVHDPKYVAAIRALRGQSLHLDADTPIGPGSIEAADLAAGVGMAAVDAVMRGECRSAFAAVRPPGHHAERAQAMGFCVFNNIAIAAEHARLTHGAERILIVDWDVHHGNGTQHIFYGRRDVLFFDVHQAPFYPGTGALAEHGKGAGEGYTINVPVPPGLGDGDYRLALDEVLVPIADAFTPDLVLVSAGFDAHRDDPLGEERVSDDGFAALAGIVQRIAQQHCQGKLVMLLEGGYDLRALGQSAKNCVDVLTGATAPTPGHASPTGERVVQAVRAAARPYWRV